MIRCPPLTEPSITFLPTTMRYALFSMAFMREDTEFSFNDLRHRQRLTRAMKNLKNRSMLGCDLDVVGRFDGCGLISPTGEAVCGCRRR